MIAGKNGFGAVGKLVGYKEKAQEVQKLFKDETRINNYEVCRVDVDENKDEDGCYGAEQDRTPTSPCGEGCSGTVTTSPW
ncbi:hypothetical protein ACMC56_05585 [Campylobacterota bacterium DY0563]